MMMAAGGSEARLHHEAAVGGGCALTHCHLPERSRRTDPVRKEREGQSASELRKKNPPNGDAQRHLAEELVDSLFHHCSHTMLISRAGSAALMP